MAGVKERPERRSSCPGSSSIRQRVSAEEIAPATKAGLTDIRAELRSLRGEIRDELREMRSDLGTELREMRSALRSNFRRLLGIMLGGFVALLGGLGGAVAHGFGWL